MVQIFALFTDGLATTKIRTREMFKSETFMNFTVLCNQQKFSPHLFEDLVDSMSKQFCVKNAISPRKFSRIARSCTFVSIQCHVNSVVLSFVERLSSSRGSQCL